MQQETAQRLIANRYLLEALDQRGVGALRRAEDTLLHRAVAVEALPLPYWLGEQERAAFSARVRQSVEAAARLRHPGAAALYDVVAESGQLYAVTELVEGLTLAELVRRHDGLHPNRVAQIGLEILGVLQAAHQLGLVHGAIMPSTVVITPEGGTKVLGFGLAALRHDPNAPRPATPPSSTMAPEQVNGAAPGPAADVWAVGATLYFAVTGPPPFGGQAVTGPPFGGQAPPATAAATRSDEPPLLDHAIWLTSAIMPLLAKPEAVRPSAADAIRLLEASGAKRPRPHAASSAPTRVAPTTAVGTGLGPAATRATAAMGTALDPAALRATAAVGASVPAATAVGAGMSAATAVGAGVPAATAVVGAALDPVATQATAVMNRTAPARRLDPVAATRATAAARAATRTPTGARATAAVTWPARGGWFGGHPSRLKTGLLTTLAAIALAGLTFYAIVAAVGANGGQGRGQPVPSEPPPTQAAATVPPPSVASPAPSSSSSSSTTTSSSVTTSTAVPAAQPIAVEAEAGRLLGGARVALCSVCSGGAKVGFVGSGGALQFNVAVKATGRWRLTLFYATWEPRSAVLTVNRRNARRIDFPPTGGFDRVGAGTLSLRLRRGHSVLTLGNPNGWAPDFDRMTLEPEPS